MQFDPNKKIEDDNIVRTRLKNATNLINLSSCGLVISRTHWQAHFLS